MAAVYRDHGLTSSGAAHDHMRAALTDSLATEALDQSQHLTACHSSSSLDTLAEDSIRSLSAAAITSSRSRVACW